ncbi:MAG: diguanylate cyclase [Candidatus Omnitrophota bacterium]|nr:diguanylate cyclase [Candidatus Omnitrophota bacterium]
MLKNNTFRILSISVILCVVYTLWISTLNPVQIASLKIIDSFFYLSSKFNPLPKTGQDIVLVSVDDSSLREVNIRWPWPRSTIADIINKISANGPAAICVDLVFAGKSVDPKEDSVLMNSLKSGGNVYAAAFFGSDGKYVVPDEALALSLKDFGFVNKPRDIDNTIRRMRPYFLSQSGGIIDYSLSLKVAGGVTNNTPASIGVSVPLSKDGATYIKFFGSLDKFNSIPAWKVLKGAADLSTLKNKLVFFGVTSESFHDTYHTPLGIMPGTVIDINETLTYINRSFFRYASHEVNSIILFIFVLIAVFGSLRLSILSGIALTACEILILLSLGLVLFLKGIIIDPIGPILLMVASTVLLHGARYVVLIVENMVLRKEAVTDGLTGLYLHRYFELQLKRELKSASHIRKNLALVIYDIDHFKKINDTYGHEFGNIVLKAIAKSLRDHSRKNNIIARYGGEEFCIIIPGMKRDHAIKYAERLRSLISHMEFKTDKGDSIRVTMSAGIVTIEDMVSPDHTSFIKAADSALYGSKNAGRDRITVFTSLRCQPPPTFSTASG